MDEQTLAALNDSINVKWRGIRYRGGKDNGTTDCQLCLRFYAPYCRGCPVYEATGKYHCYGSPYLAWDRHQIEAHEAYMHRGMHLNCEECEDLCDAQITFLESLLPALT